MGNIIGYYIESALQGITQAALKRKIEDVDTDNENSCNYDSVLNAPKR